MSDQKRLLAVVATHRRHSRWRAAVLQTLAVAVAFVLFASTRRPGETTFVFGPVEVFAPAAPLVVNSTTAALAAVIVAAGLAALRWAAVTMQRAAPAWQTVALTVVLAAGFLTWAAAGQSVPVTGLLAGALGLSVPIIFGALGGVLSERVGVVNVAIEGQLLAGAFCGAVAGSITQSVVIGMLAAAVAGVLVAIVLAVFSIRYLVDQVIVGIVLNVLVLGLTGFLASSLLQADPVLLNTPPQLAPVAIPMLSALPVIGPVLFVQPIIVYVMYVAVIAVTVILYRTPWGLRLRAVGEHPRAADTAGIKVNATRFWTVSLAGAIAGLGGAYFSLAAVPAFTENVTSGVGYIALAAVIFGGWNPVRAALAALLFGFVGNLQNVLGILGSPVPSGFLLMAPYVVTLVAVAGLSRRATSPAALGRAYPTT